MVDVPPRQIVRSTRCLDVRGHPAMLTEMMSFIGYRWYLEYTVEEQFLGFNQTSTALSGSTRTTLESLSLSSLDMALV